METLEFTETLAEDSSQPPGSQTLEAPGASDPSTVRNGPESESRVSGLGLSPKRSGRRHGGRALAAATDPKPVAEAEAETLATVVPVPDHEEPGLGLPPGGSPEMGDAEENLAGAEEEGTGGEESSFVVGDFVWAKIKSHPWWPGQVYDPSQASNHAKNAHRKDRCVLVAYFGDSSFAWCKPSQLKPFKQEFHQMVKQSSSKNFMGAVGDALDRIGQCLESELTCYCVPPEEKNIAVNVGRQVGRYSIANYAPGEFLEHLHDAAPDASMANLLEATMLRSWVSAFGKMCFSSGMFLFRKRRETVDLVEKIDLDAPPADSFEGDQDQEEGWITGSGAVKKPEISEEKLYRSRKRRSMAKLIAEMDSDSVELSDGEEDETVVPNKSSPSKRKKKDENEKGSDVENDSVKTEEEKSLGRRERKKSKYLSPPYTYLGGYAKIPSSPKNVELKSPKKDIEASWALLSGSPTISKCNSDGFQEEEDKRSPLFKIDSTSASEIFSEFLSAALNIMHMKWNRSAKTVKGFFAIRRSSVYSHGSDFEAYQEHLGECGGIDRKSADKETTDRSKEVRPEGKRRRKAEAIEEIPSNLGQDITCHSEKRKTWPMRKMRKEGADGVSPLNSGQDTKDPSEQGKAGPKRKRRKEGADVVTPLVLDQDADDPSEQGKARPKSKMRVEGAKVIPLNSGQGPNVPFEQGMTNRKIRDGGADGVTPLELGEDTNVPSEQGKAGLKRKTRKEGADGVTPFDLGQATNVPSEQGKARPKRKTRKERADGVTPFVLGQDADVPSEQGKAGPESKMRKEGADGVTPLDLGQDTNTPSEQGNAGPKRRMRKNAKEETPSDCIEQGKAGPKGGMRRDSVNIKAPVDLNLQITNGSEEGKSPHKKKKGMYGANAETLVGFGHKLISCAKAGKIGQKMIKGKEVCNEKTPMELGPVLVDCSKEGKSGHQKKSNDGLSAETPVDLGCGVIKGMEAGKSGQKKKKKNATINRNPAALLLTFAPGIALPSKDNLISTFSKYGDLIETETELSQESGCARVVFAKSTDAEKALNSRDKSGVFGPTVPSYRLSYLPGNSSSPTLPVSIPKPPLPYIRKNLERMISSLAGSSSPEKDAGSSDGLKPEARDNLVGEMKGLLTKVDKMLNGPTSGISS